MGNTTEGSNPSFSAMITSHQRGHLIEYDGKKWVYFDDKTSIHIERPCIRCGKMPTIEGYDWCLGHVDDVTSACCGHGVGQFFAIKRA